MKTIAIVEDNPDNLMLLQALLHERFILQEYADGPSAAKGIAQDVPDLVLMDISLPGMDGVAVLQHLRGQKALADLPVIALTAHAMVGDRERFLAEGFDFYISKPILSLEQLLEPIHHFLDLSATADTDTD